jgi:transcriptional regulator with XRE-family HTH domain
MAQLYEIAAANIKHLREASELTQAQLSIKARISINTLGRIESGTKDFRLVALSRIATALNVTPGSLLYANLIHAGQ